MENYKNKEEYKKAQQEIAELSVRISALEVEYNSLNDKYIKEDLKRGEFERRLEISKQLRELKAEKSSKQSKINGFINEDMARLTRLAAEEERANEEAYSKPVPAPEKKNPEKAEKLKESGTRVGIFAIIAMLVLVGILAAKDKGTSTPSVNQLYEQEIEGLKSRTPMSEEEIKEALVGVQRMLYSGKLPKGEYLGNLTYEYYLAKSTELMGTLGNPKDNNGSYESIDHADWAKEELLKKFIEKYDVVYNDIAKDLNSGNYESLEANIRKLADMQFDDFKMAGLKGGINPYGFKPQYRMAALLAATDRYSMVAEYVLQNNICWNACKNQATGKMTQVPVFSMYEVLFIDGGVSTDGKIALDSLGTSLPKDQSLYDTFLSEACLYFQAREDNPITRIFK